MRQRYKLHLYGMSATADSEDRLFWHLGQKVYIFCMSVMPEKSN